MTTKSILSILGMAAISLTVIAASAQAKCSSGFLANTFCQLGVIDQNTARGLDNAHKQMGNPLDQAAYRALDAYAPGAGAALQGMRQLHNGSRGFTTTPVMPAPGIRNAPPQMPYGPNFGNFPPQMPYAPNYAPNPSGFNAGAQPGPFQQTTFPGHGYGNVPQMTTVCRFFSGQVRDFAREIQAGIARPAFVGGSCFDEMGSPGVGVPNGAY